MNSTITQEIALLRDFLDRESDLGIIIGSHQNLDTYAAALSLYLSLIQSGKKVQIISKKEPTVEVSNLVGIDKVKGNFVGNTSKLVVALPYIKGEVEKVLFTEAPDTINFHLTAAEGKGISPFELSDVKLMWEGGAPTAVITVGVSNPDELTGTIDANSTKIVNIDNFQGNTRFGDVILVDEGFSSLSEVVGKIIKDLSLPSDIDVAQDILDGVLYATRNFTKGNTSPLAFEAVSAAMYVGAVRKEEVRREQNMGGQNRQGQMPDRQSRDQGQDRGQDRGNRDQGRQQQPNRQSRVSDTDFPAMHMQNRPNQQSQGNDNRRMGNNPQRNIQNPVTPPRVNQQFGQDRNVNDVRNRIMEESKRPQQFEPAPPIEDAQIVSEPQITPPIEEVQMPEEQPYTPQSTEEIPDDWLMPKVFKSSKNNN